MDEWDDILELTLAGGDNPNFIADYTKARGGESELSEEEREALDELRTEGIGVG